MCLPLRSRIWTRIREQVSPSPQNSPYSEAHTSHRSTSVHAGSRGVAIRLLSEFDPACAVTLSSATNGVRVGVQSPQWTAGRSPWSRRVVAGGHVAIAKRGIAVTIGGLWLMDSFRHAS